MEASAMMEAFTADEMLKSSVSQLRFRVQHQEVPGGQERRSSETLRSSLLQLMPLHHLPAALQTLAAFLHMYQ
ncbi:unnamed protein product [Lampetra planeri]